MIRMFQLIFMKLQKKLNAQPELVFGRIYYHLNQKYSYRDADGVLVNLYVLLFRDKNDNVIIEKSIQFPLLSSILAGLNEERMKFITPLTISVFALIFSGLALFKSC